MTSYFDYSNDFCNAINDVSKLSSLYHRWLNELFKNQLWSGNKQDINQGVMRFNWRSAEEAFKQDIFASTGLYIFCVEKTSGINIPRYIGRYSSGHIRNRLRQRHTGPSDPSDIPSECELAAIHENDLMNNGIDGLPKDMRDRYEKKFGKGARARLKIAEDFANQGISGIWFAILPIEDRDNIEFLEISLIKIGCKYNKEKNYPKLTNSKHNKC